MELADRERARIAAERFGEALAGFQGDMPPVTKSRSVKEKNSTATRYLFASIDDVDVVARPILARWNLSVSGTITSTDTAMIATWTIRCGSHKEDRVITLPKVAAAGIAHGVNPIQDLGAWMSYLRRYTYCLALNIIVTDEDTDANQIQNVLLLNDEQRAALADWIANGALKTDGSIHKIDEKRLLALYQSDVPEADRSLDRLTQTDFASIVSTFRIKQKGGSA
jgi:ERF superfamily